jgi:hypothetical protein
MCTNAVDPARVRQGAAVSIPGVFFRRALDRARGLPITSPARIGRPLMVLGIAAGLLASALGPTSPVRAADPPDPAARLQLVIHKIDVQDDHDLWGSGEMLLEVKICPMGDAIVECRPGPTISSRLKFSASTGDTVTFDRVVPDDRDVADGGASAEAGLPVYPGQRYLLHAQIREEDSGLARREDLGKVTAVLEQGNDWHIGTTRGVSDEGFDPDSCCGQGQIADYLLTYEIRRTPLPDLQVHGFGVVDAGEGRFLCGQIENVGQRSSPLIPLTVRANEATVRTTTVTALEPGQTTELCIPRAELPARTHGLWFALDEPRQIPEMDETNNLSGLAVRSLEPSSSASVPAPSPEPKPTVEKAEPSGDKPDLTVSAIRVNGQVPDGKNDCKDGKNTVAVIVRNAGTVASDTFGLRLTVDGVDLDAGVLGLNAGQEREITFNDVQLKKGEHGLKAVADPARAIDETKDNNNELKVSARCADAS